MRNTIDSPRVAIVYHYLAHYREPVFRLLCQQTTPDPEYTLISGIKREREDQSKIATIDPHKSNIPIRAGGLRWHHVHNIWFGRIILWQTGLLRMALSNKYDVIIFLGSMYFVSTWFSAFIARLYGKKVLMWSHGYLAQEDNLKGLLRKAFYKISDGMLLYGNRARKIMIQKGFSSDRLYVIYNSLEYDKQRIVRDSISPEVIKTLREKLFTHAEFPILFFIGRLTMKKRLDMIVDAAKRLHEEKKPVNLLFIGSGPEETRLKSLVIQYKLLDFVYFYGECYAEDEIGPLIMSADICVSPGEVGLTSMHSMAYGKPVITHDEFSKQMPEFESIMPGKTGSFFTHGDSASLTAAISYWIADDRYSKANMDCISVIEGKYNPHVQVMLINAAVNDVFTKKKIVN